MRNRLKSFFIIILVAIFGVCLFSGCDISTSNSYFETEYFMCQYDGNDEVIIGGTIEGLEIDVLIIPTEINGKKVSTIGYRYGHHNHFNNSAFRKIYIPPYVRYGRPNLFTSRQPGFVVILLSVEPNKSYGNKYFHVFSTPNIFIPFDASETYENILGHSFPCAPVSYMNNYNETINGGYYWIDVYNDDGSLIEPPTPKREGYDFEGWYEESECINIWDFNEGRLFEYETLEDLYSRYENEEDRNIKRQLYEEYERRRLEEESLYVRREYDYNKELYAKWQAI